MSGHSYSHGKIFDYKGRLSKSEYYDWLGRGPSKRAMENEAISWTVWDIYENSFGSHGAPRIKAELLKRRYRASRLRVARIMKANSLFARRKRKFKITTDGSHDYSIGPYILEREFKVSRANQIWVSDIKLNF